MIHASDSLLREIECSCTSEESQILPAVFRMNIHKNAGISQVLFVIPVMVRQHSHVHQKFSLALRRAPNHNPITPVLLLDQSSENPVTSVPVVGDPSYSEGQPECPPWVQYSPEIDASKFTLHILSDTPGVIQRLEYILLMDCNCSRCLHLNQWSSAFTASIDLVTQTWRFLYLQLADPCSSISGTDSRLWVQATWRRYVMQHDALPKH